MDADKYRSPQVGVRGQRLGGDSDDTRCGGAVEKEDAMQILLGAR